MTTDPDQIPRAGGRAARRLPNSLGSQDDATIATMDNAAQRLAQAHDVLVAAPGMVEKD